MKDSPLESTTREESKFQEGDNKDNILKLTNTKEKNNDLIYSKLKRKDRRGGSSTASKEHKDNKSISWRPKFNLVLVILVILMLGLFVSLIVIAAYFSLELSELRTQLSDTKNYKLNINKHLQSSIAELTAQFKKFKSTIKHHSQFVNETSLVAIHSSCKQTFQLHGIPVPGCCQLQPSSGPPRSSYYYTWTVPCSNIAGRWTRVAKLNNCNGVPLCFDNLTVSNITNTSGCVAMNITTPGCASVTFSTPPGLSYSHICGIVQGVAYNTPDGFKNGAHIYNTTYVDGITFILPKEQPIRHVFTFSAYGGAGKTLPCSNNVPEFVHEDYQCMVTVRNSTCPITEKCSPFFHRDLGKLTSGDIEMRICRDQDSDDEEIILKDLELYIL